MPEKPITPTRIIPAGAPLPDRGPLPGELPPWWQAPAPPPPPPPPAVVAPPAPAPPPPPDPQIHLHHHLLIPYVAPPEPTRRERLWAWLRTIGRPWQACGALLLAVVPVPGVDHSAASIWAYSVGQARAEWGAQQGYALAAVPLGWAILRAVKHGPTLRRLWLGVIGVFGLIGAIDLFDIVTLLTGVTR
ncbi:MULTISPECIES: hypothetical protein [unclassified Streptomyces]|uniref:hypothetical protein n=1 Tax=unclassified Streptomyces TaxID=2593676 RepID=UPI00381CE01A